MGYWSSFRRFSLDLSITSHSLSHQRPVSAVNIGPNHYASVFRHHLQISERTGEVRAPLSIRLGSYSYVILNVWAVHWNSSCVRSFEPFPVDILGSFPIRQSRSQHRIGVRRPWSAGVLRLGDSCSPSPMVPTMDARRLETLVALVPIV